jgi:hypothetical protein
MNIVQMNIQNGARATYPSVFNKVPLVARNICATLYSLHGCEFRVDALWNAR